MDSAVYSATLTSTVRSTTALGSEMPKGCEGWSRTVCHKGRPNRAVTPAGGRRFGYDQYHRCRIRAPCLVTSHLVCYGVGHAVAAATEVHKDLPEHLPAALACAAVENDLCVAGGGGACVGVGLRRSRARNYTCWARARHLEEKLLGLVVSPARVVERSVRQGIAAAAVRFLGARWPLVQGEHDAEALVEANAALA